ncbi:MAG: MFS transporter [Prevotella sp.]|jgi:FHS family L-fucose permease-like MFS transporter|uniref:MFS transporter n=1 Tax=Prevotella sp. lc2012 TaxID=1761886 RepID=UPI00089C6185|nr:MFS transporter [Prevotella sp. lc2012]MBR5392120.1 MFS transporter [Prevotella sp.]MBR5748463.1 MFS transporter [Prevotella sp.]MBR5988844.1 MFS transporter [Prevotella sp.]SEE00269.1 MFS transporter, FHS family, L-fucose permease [Prevotella sp. lc2012]
MSTQKQNGSIIAIITMMFLYAMISFVTNLGAPIGVIWKSQPEIGGSNVLGIMGNFMNFFAYLFMGIPAGKMLTKVGYKKTALIGIAVGFIGVLIQFLSGFSGGISGFCVYLFGAFISGFSVCILNTVVNPMLNLLGGGGNRGNQLNMIGGTLNSLSGTLTPMLVGALIGTVTASTQMADVNLVMYIAMTVFAAAFVALLFIPIQDPEMGKVTADTKFEHSPWAFRHCLLGVIAIFVYVGVEVGIPGGLNFYLSDTSDKGAGLLADAATIGGSVAAMYWLLMLVGRLISSAIAAKVSSRQMMLFTTSVGMILILAAMLTPKSVTVTMPLVKILEGTVEMTTVPMSAMLLVLVGLCTSVMWASIFNLATEGLGKYTAQASGIFMMMVVGGGVLPVVQNFFADIMGYMPSYFIYLLGVAYMFYYALIGCKNVNKDIPVD